ncbi:hypothetical protein BU15DRAFT_59002 [Melanogaster broomeanus]|nr:hypothetical protein BU15DRAFT_59002 [Melanogaster broomeanus]
MLSDTQPQQVAFPVEVICHILCFMSPREIVRLRRISKQFRDITYDRAIWNTVYANARLPRLPGPFACQSTQFLEHTLVQSERLAQTWTSQPFKVISCTLEPTGLRSGLDQWTVLSGRWFIWCETKQLLCRDLDDGSLQVLWDGDIVLIHCHARLVTSVDGQRVYVLLRGIAVYQGGLMIMKLLEFKVDDHCGSFQVPALVSLDVPLLPEPTPSAISGQWPFLAIAMSAWTLVWDMRTRIFYKLPPFSSAFDSEVMEEGSISHPPQLILSKTHVIAAYHRRDGKTFIFQAFVVPDAPRSAGDGIRELRLTHEASVDPSPSLLSLLRSQRFTVSSDDGHLRGFTGGPSQRSDGLCVVRKFSVDASAESCVVVVGQPCPMPYIGWSDFTSGYYEFDGVGGRFCYTQKEDRKDYYDLVVVDLA